MFILLEKAAFLISSTFPHFAPLQKYEKISNCQGKFGDFSKKI
jgi:hypothetical protein